MNKIMGKMRKNGIDKRTGRRMIASVVLPIAFSAAAQAQTVRGVVTDAASGEPLSYVTVKVVEAKTGATTNEQGEFEIKDLPVGRYTVEASYVGYTPYVVKEVLVSGNKDVSLNISIQENVNTLSDVVVRPDINKEMPLNKMVLTGGRMLSVEEASRYAGGLDDPARLVTAFAGVTGSVSSNGVSVHGNAPQALSWRIEGVEVFSPNHFSDSYNMGGGAISALSANVLSNSDFLTDAYPAEYGNSVGGVFDMKLRAGNNSSYEQTFQAGTAGIDFAAEGPLAKGSRASYLFNYRYSFVGLATKLGILDLDGDKADYQDLGFKINMPTQKAGTFSFWGMGYIDKSWVDMANPKEWETLYDQNDLQVRQKLFSVGLSHKIWLGEGASLNTTLASSYFFNHTYEDFYEDAGNNTLSSPLPYTDVDQTSGRLTGNVCFMKKVSNQFTTKLGANYTHLTFKNRLKYADVIGDPLVTCGDMTAKAGLLDFYTSNSWEASQRFTLNFGVNAQAFMLNGDWSVEPRVSCQWHTSEHGTLSFGYGLNSQVEKLDVYFVEKDGKNVNHDLNMTRAHHMQMSYLHMLNADLALRAEVYYQRMFDMPIAEEGTFAVVNRNEYYIDSKLVSKGLGRNYGMTLSLEQYLHKGLFWMVNGSLYNAEYRDINKRWHDTRYNSRYSINALGGKEWMMGKAKKNLLNASVKFTYQGGLRYSPIDKAATIAAFENGEPDVVSDETRPFTEQFDPTFTMDMTVSYKVNRKSVSHEFALKLINVFQTKVPFKHVYNYKKNEVETYDWGIAVPNICYRINF